MSDLFFVSFGFWQCNIINSIIFNAFLLRSNWFVCVFGALSSDFDCSFCSFSFSAVCVVVSCNDDKYFKNESAIE